MLDLFSKIQRGQNQFTHNYCNPALRFSSLSGWIIALRACFFLEFNIDRVKEIPRCSVPMNISAGAFVRFGSFRAGMMQLVSKHIQQLSLALGHHCSLVVAQWQVVNGSILAKAGVSVKRQKDTLIPT
jgi:hypothetical protein